MSKTELKSVPHMTLFLPSERHNFYICMDTKEVKTRQEISLRTSFSISMRPTDSGWICGQNLEQGFSTFVLGSIIHVCPTRLISGAETPVGYPDFHIFLILTLEEVKPAPYLGANNACYEGELLVTARQKILRGEQITIDYGHSVGKLKRYYGFDCDCGACTPDGSSVGEDSEGQMTENSPPKTDEDLW